MAAVAVVRVSGPMAGVVLQSIAGRLPVARVFTFAALRDPATAELLDRAVVIWCPGPGSATGEDLAEFHVHGSAALAQELFRVFMEFAGVRPAEAGEFTRRAFVNGKLDLVEVEGLVDLLASRTRGQWRQAMGQFGGRASSVFDGWRTQMIELLAWTEAAIDFADEDGVAESAIEKMQEAARGLVKSMEDAVGRSEQARAMRDGVKVVLAGRPNTGKSSLLNAIAQRDAAIVSPIPGTTRDVVEVWIDLHGAPVVVTDTAGLRDVTADDIERIGMRRSRREAETSDLLIWVWSRDVEGSESSEIGMACDLVVENKADLPVSQSELIRNDLVHVHRISATDGTGIAELLTVLGRLVEGVLHTGETVIVANSRQRSALLDSIRHLNEARKIGTTQLELVATELRGASDALGRITGRVGVEDWLGAIFNKFCIGK